MSIASRFASQIWWTRGVLDNGVWHWADPVDSWFTFDSSSSENPSNNKVSLQTENWINMKSAGSYLFHKICEMSKYNRMVLLCVGKLKLYPTMILHQH